MRACASVTMPDVATVGIGFIATPRLRLGLDLNVVMWSSFRQLFIDFTNNDLDNPLPKRWRDTMSVHLGGEYSHAVRKVPASGDFRVQDHHGGTVVDHEPTSAELAVARDALMVATNETGLLPLYARVDLVDLAGPVVMELELVEPELFLRRAPGSADRFAAAIAAAIPH